ncbi:putative cytokinetic ring protein SteA [Luteipulveratus sp. YIM 133132]|uniref:putative cytokinetic ring protein SteA n=1 Tax=Luteipulveratus flavus TaxID=3031728 RepID=UPI0023B01494|nr:putative cytokinetic ring protein SteA [Luteipulveratus sp. YIM 133132]MDE9366089.1 putative cytokinetic ring protein SteA [Luteipulveratus sp. YIM 133132]
MRFPLRRRVSPEPAGVGGTVRVDARTKNLTKRLRPGDVAVINHRDIDQVSAEALVACRPAAVVNAAESISGRYPNLGPSILVEAGIPLLDHVGEPVMSAVSDGESARVHDGELIVGDTVIARGTVLDAAAIEVAMADARAGLSTQMEAFAANTMEYLLQERDLLLDGVGLPDIRTDMEGRHVLVVVRGYHYKEDLQMLRPFIRDYKPVLIGVDGGADALVEAGLKPTMIVGDMDSVSDSTLRCGAEVVVHAYRDGRAPGLSRVQELGVKDPVVFPATGTSEDIAMLLADDKGADLIVAVGTHATLVEFLDKGRAGMASTFLTRLRVGSKLVDAKGVSRLYRTSVPTWMLVVLVLAGFLALFVALGSTPAGDTIFQLLGSRWDAFWSWLTGVFE